MGGGLLNLFVLAFVMGGAIYLTRSDPEDGAVFACVFIAGMSALVSFLAFMGLGLDRNVGLAMAFAFEAALYLYFAVYLGRRPSAAIAAAVLYGLGTAAFFGAGPSGQGAFVVTILRTFILLVLFRGAFASMDNKEKENKRRNLISTEALQRDDPPPARPSSGRMVRPPGSGRVVRPSGSGRVVRPSGSGRIVRPPDSGTTPSAPEPKVSGRRIGKPKPQEPDPPEA